MGIKNGLTILWDFDGTLFDTYPVYTRIFQKVLHDEHIDGMEVFKQLKVSFRHAVTHYNFSKEQIQELAVLEEEILPQEMKPFDGVERILAHASNNVIMTHKPRKDVRNILDYYGWNDYFSEIVAGDDGFPRKPNVESYIYLHQRHKIDLVIGDRELDILPGKELGIATCLFQNVDSSLADFYLDHYDDFWSKVKL